jgi:acetyl esterase
VPDLALLDPALKNLLDQLAAMGGPETSQLTPTEAREAYQMLRALDAPPAEVGAVTDRDVAGVPCRVYEPFGAEAAGTLVWVHGGGWTIGDLDTADAVARSLANASGCEVVSVGYRLAPEAPFPAAVDDCWAVVSEVAAGRGAVAVGGDSAGGNLAAVTALLARDAGVVLRHQLLVYPVTDLSRESPSYAENGEGFLLTADTMRWFINHYTAPSDRTSWKASPLLADDLAGVAPAHVVTAGFDPLRDEGDAYAARLAEAGVPVVHDRVEGATHAFFAMSGVTPLASDAVARAAGLLARAMALDPA